jgi:hypothetical protein
VFLNATTYLFPHREIFDAVKLGAFVQLPGQRLEGRNPLEIANHAAVPGAWRIEDAQAALREQGYVANEGAATVVLLGALLDKPILVEGPAGVGKTALALAWAKALGRRLIRLQCYEGLDESRALYEWSYGRQLLATQLAKEFLSRESGPRRPISLGRWRR